MTQVALGVAFGGVESTTEKIGGIGGDAVNKLVNPASFLGKAALSTASEAGEEIIAGRAQDALTVAAGQTVADPQRPGFTRSGYELPSLNPLDPRTLAKMKQEAIGGAAGGVLFSALPLVSTPQQEPVSGASLLAQVAARGGQYDAPLSPSPISHPPSPIPHSPDGPRLHAGDRRGDRL